MTPYLKKLGFYLAWLVKCGLLGQKIPINSSLIITDKCNLNCQHCVVAHLGYEDLSYEQICQDVDTLFATGSRVLVITGGEPFLWRGLAQGLEDVVRYAREKGFFRIVICTNGTFPLTSSADYLWVSLDGSPEEHNHIRGDIYNTVINNLADATHKGIYINFTITQNNSANFESSATKILAQKNIKGILFHLYTPYLGSDKNLELDAYGRKDVIKRLRRLKKRYARKIFNTFAGLQALEKNDWQRPLWGSVTINQGQLGSCCCRVGIYNEAVCRNCGCTPAVETWVLQSMKLSAIMENMRFL